MIPEANCGLPAASCVIAQEAFKSVQEDVADIKRAIVGHPEMGQLGLVARVGTVEKECATVQADIHRYKERLLGLVAGASFVGSVVGFGVQILLK